MSEFMMEHQNFAKNLLPNCSQGKAMSQILWQQLAEKLNTAGPPIKEAKSWRKVFADQKHNVKKKLSFNKASKKQTGGGPYQEKLLTAAEEQLLEATGMDVAVDGLAVQSFGNAMHSRTIRIAEPESPNAPDPVDAFLRKLLDNDEEDSDDSSVLVDAPEAQKGIAEGNQKRRHQKQAETKLSLLKSNLQAHEGSQAAILSKLDKLIALKERSLAMKEEEHAINMAYKKVKLYTANIKLSMLREQ